MEKRQQNTKQLLKTVQIAIQKLSLRLKANEFLNSFLSQNKTSSLLPILSNKIISVFNPQKQPTFDIPLQTIIQDKQVHLHIHLCKTKEILSEITMNMLREVASFNAPPEILHRLITVIFLILQKSQTSGKNMESYQTWSNCRKMLNSAINFMKALQDLKVEDVLNKKHFHKIEELWSNGLIQEKRVNQCSRVGGYLFLWAKGVMQGCRMRQQIDNLKEKTKVNGSQKMREREQLQRIVLEGLQQVNQIDLKDQQKQFILNEWRQVWQEVTLKQEKAK